MRDRRANFQPVPPSERLSQVPPTEEQRCSVSSDAGERGPSTIASEEFSERLDARQIAHAQGLSRTMLNALYLAIAGGQPAGKDATLPEGPGCTTADASLAEKQVLPPPEKQ